MAAVVLLRRLLSLAVVAAAVAVDHLVLAVGHPQFWKAQNRSAITYRIHRTKACLKDTKYRRHRYQDSTLQIRRVPSLANPIRCILQIRNIRLKPVCQVPRVVNTSQDLKPVPQAQVVLQTS